MPGSGFISQKKPWYKRWWVIVLFVLIIFVSIFGGYYVYQVYKIYTAMKAGTYIAADLKTPYDMKVLVDPQSPRDGQAVNPKIVIVEFGDFNCSKCKKAMPIVRQVMAKYGVDVALFWRNFPVISESSLALARTGVCVNEQGKFWLFHDLIYSGGVSGASALDDALPTIGVDMVKLSKCLQNKLTTAQIKKDYYIGKDAAVGGTPTFFVNGYKIQGAIPFDQWEIIIKKFLDAYEKNAGN